jgi:hypothetical protein
VYPARNSFQKIVTDFKKRHKKAAVAAEFILALPGTPGEDATVGREDRFRGIGSVPRA